MPSIKALKEMHIQTQYRACGIINETDIKEC